MEEKDRSAICDWSSKCCTLTCANPESLPLLFHFRFYSNRMPPIK